MASGRSDRPRPRQPKFFQARLSLSEPLESRTLFAGADLDPAFSGDGKATIGLTASGNEWATAVAPLADGRLLVGGRGERPRAQFARYLPDGQLDPAFGEGGKVSLRMDPTFQGVVSLATFPDGSSVAAVRVDSPAPALIKLTPAGAPDPTWIGRGGFPQKVIALSDGRCLVLYSFAVARLNTDGSLDTSFGHGDGFIEARQFGQGTGFTAAAVLPDGRIVVARTALAQVGLGREVSLHRFSPSGERDTAFDANRRTVLPVASSEVSGDHQLAVGAGGRVLLGGDLSGRSFVARFSADGPLDAAFGSGGVREFEASEAYWDRPVTLLEAADGSVVVGGLVNIPTDRDAPYLARLTAAGHPDLAFGGNGVVEQPLPAAWLTRSGGYVAFAGDGRLLMASGGGPSTAETEDFTLTRHNSDGSRDTTFGGAPEGVVRTDFPRPVTPVARRSALQADGKVVQTGFDADALNTHPTDFLLARMNADGSPDNAFGGRGDGVARADFGARDEFAADVEVQPDGKLIVVGEVDDWGAVARFNADGTADGSFGSGGKVRTSGSAPFRVVALQQDNRILAAGGNVVVRYLPNGDLDPAFGSRVIDVPGTAESIVGVVPLAGSRVLVSGSVFSTVPGVPGLTDSDRFVARLTPTGQLDPTFGAAGTGVVILDSGSREEVAVGVAVDADGRIYVAGTSHVAGGSLALTRLSADGVVDASFASGGTRTVPLGAADPPRSFITTPQGQFLLAGAHRTPTGTPQVDRDFLVIRLNGDGSPDPAFGNGGMRTIDFGSPFDEAIDVHQDTSGRIVVTGGTGAPALGAPEPGGWAAARLAGGSATAPPTVTDIRFDMTYGKHAVRVTFSEDVRNSLDAGDLVVRNVDTGQEVTAQRRVITGDYLGGPTTVEWQYTGPAATLPNANYLATVSGAGVTDPQGNPLGGDVRLDFFVLTGDINRDRKVDGADFGVLASNFGRTGMAFAQGDLNGDGRVDGADFALLAGNFGKSVPAPAAAPAPAVAPAAAAGSPAATAPAGAGTPTQPRQRALPRRPVRRVAPVQARPAPVPRR